MPPLHRTLPMHHAETRGRAKPLRSTATLSHSGGKRDDAQAARWNAALYFAGARPSIDAPPQTYTLTSSVAAMRQSEALRPSKTRDGCASAQPRRAVPLRSLTLPMHSAACGAAAAERPALVGYANARRSSAMPVRCVTLPLRCRGMPSRRRALACEALAVYCDSEPLQGDAAARMARPPRRHAASGIAHAQHCQRIGPPGLSDALRAVAHARTCMAWPMLWDARLRQCGGADWHAEASRCKAAAGR